MNKVNKRVQKEPCSFLPRLNFYTMTLTDICALVHVRKEHCSSPPCPFHRKLYVHNATEKYQFCLPRPLIEHKNFSLCVQKENSVPFCFFAAT